MTAKELNQKLGQLFEDSKNEKYITYEKIVEVFEKQPTLAQARNILKLAKKHDINIITSSERAKLLNIEEAKNRESERQKLSDNSLEEEFDFTREKELLEWSRSDSPVRMYLREMGQIPLLTKEEEIEISKKIEMGEDIIIDAICSVPYLIDFILDYKEPLINRERRVKELFKSFEDETEEEETEESETTKKNSKQDKRVQKVIESFKALEKAKKDWLKTLSKTPAEDASEEEKFHYELQLSFKKKTLRERLLDLGPTSKLINELVKAMETALKSDEGFEKELKRLEYRLPLFNDQLKENHKKILDNIVNMSKDEIAAAVPEATMVSTYLQIKKLFQTKEASKDSFNLDPEKLQEILEKRQKQEWQNQISVLLYLLQKDIQTAVCHSLI